MRPGVANAKLPGAPAGMPVTDTFHVPPLEIAISQRTRRAVPPLTQTNEASGIHRASTVDPKDIVSIWPFKGESRSDSKFTDDMSPAGTSSRIRDDSKIFGSASPECQCPIERMARLVITAESCDVEWHVFWARTAGEERFCEDVRPPSKYARCFSMFIR